MTASLRAAPRGPRRSPGHSTATCPRRGVAARVGRRVATACPAGAALHDQGLAALLRLGGDDIRQFFESFFELPVEVWAPYSASTSERPRCRGR
ncbi:MAG: hypothetical protein R2713_02140 [Ilumatobacteraceae bacterium]